MVSVIIPTKNEELWLANLLAQITTIPEITEIIVVDNNSSDKTRSIAQSFGCKLFDGGLPGVSRNIGARQARSEHLIFLDADTTIDRLLLRTTIEHLAEPGVAAVHFFSIPKTNDNWIRFYYQITNWFFFSMDKLGFSYGLGSFVAARKSAFLEIDGFNEQIKVGEDVDFFRRISKVGRVVYSKENHVYVSARRLFIENKILFPMKCVFWMLLRLVGTSISLIDYQWKTYREEIFRFEEGWLNENRNLFHY